MKENKNTMRNFFSLMDWDMLQHQQNVLKAIRDTIVRSPKRRRVIQHIITVVDFWLSCKNRHIDQTMKFFYDHPLSTTQPVNWEMLRDDKRELLRIQQLKSINDDKWEVIEGILNGIDSFQDAAVDELGIDKNIVFNFSKN